MILPKVEPQKGMPPYGLPLRGLRGVPIFDCSNKCPNRARDTVYEQVRVHRYEYSRCRRTFRVYPAGVTPAHVSLRVKGLAAMLSLLGLSYGLVIPSPLEHMASPDALPHRAGATRRNH